MVSKESGIAGWLTAWLTAKAPVTKAGVTKGVTTELSIAGWLPKCKLTSWLPAKPPVTEDWLPVAVTSETVLFEAVTVAHVTGAVTAEAE